ncbi:MAG: hypothetical protein JXA57_01575 [Armatimonadetes bacterium]|nr:hypothetical protein [Armatimonadota bacterium]
MTLLETIAAKIQSVVQMIQEKERADPEYVLQGRWNQDFRESAEYQYVLELGPKAVKPAYYIIYKSEYAGLYEYMIASAIDDITRYDYTVKQGFRWSNSKVFLETYNEKVVNTLAAFTSIMENRRLTEGDKLEEIRRLGVFVVAPLLSAIDDTFPGQPAGYLEDCLWSVVEDYTGERPACDLLQWRRENERAYREIVETLKL